MPKHHFVRFAIQVGSYTDKELTWTAMGALANDNIPVYRLCIFEQVRRAALEGRVNPELLKEI